MIRHTMKDEYPAWVCIDCVKKAPQTNINQQVFTFHLGECGVCGEETVVTDPKNYGYPNFAMIGDI